ncbi:MAG: cation:proton antiporter [Rickettsiales bacterium]|jgi:Kef-type K+ transport system membrane component KefB/voltage-gated potassium channel Kch|nr:cation:proton antiporter [Rickettsiales bacterium]
MQLLIFLGLAFGLIYLLKLAHVGTLMAFLVAGIVVGPHALDLFNISETWEFLGQLGVAFLWFVMGLELNVRRIWQMRGMIFGFGASQVFVAVLMMLPLLFIFTGWPALSIVMVAMLLAMSSTSSDLQILADKNELHSSFGRQSFSILLFQDLLSIPLLAMLPVFSGKSLNLGGDIVDILVISAGLIFGAFLIGRVILNPIMRAASKLKSREAFIIIILLNITLWSVVLDWVGLPPAMGAFLAGMLMSETVYRHQVRADIAPYQVMFLAFFFIVLGLGMNIPLIANNWLVVIGGAALLMSIKFGALYMVGQMRGVSRRESLKIGILLSQGGEFGLLMLNTILSSGMDVIPKEHAQILMAVIVISMMMTPIFVKGFDFLERRGFGFRGEVRRASPAGALDGGAPVEKPQVVICGFGRVGQTIAKMFQAQKIPYAALDMDVDQVVLGRREGYTVFYGDSTREDVLRSLRLDNVKTCVLALDNMAVIKKTVRAMKAASPRVKIFARSRNLMEADALIKQGVAVALPETIESSFVLGQEVLIKLGVPEAEINSMLEHLRRDSYAALADILEKNDPNYFKRHRKQIRELQHILLKGEVPAKKKTLDDVVEQKK